MLFIFTRVSIWIKARYIKPQITLNIQIILVIIFQKK